MKIGRDPIIDHIEPPHNLLRASRNFTPDHFFTLGVMFQETRTDLPSKLVQKVVAVAASQSCAPTALLTSTVREV